MCRLMAKCPNLRQQATTLLSNSTEFANWPLCERLLPHALIVTQRIGDEPNEAEAASRLLNQTAYYLRGRARYDEAELLYQRALQIREQVLGPDHPDTAGSLNNLAALLKSQGKYDEAEPLYRRALQIREQVLGPDHPNTITTRKNFQIFLREQGREDEAASLTRGT